MKLVWPPAAWQRWARRIDALSLRERAIGFVSAAVVCLAVADALVISPSLAERKRLAAQVRSQAAALAALRAQVAPAEPAADDPLARLQAALAHARDEREALEREIAALRARHGDGARAADLVERVLRRHERLTLLRLAAVDEPPKAPAEAATLPMQTIDLGVGGPYLDLARYLAEIEQALPGLRWGELKIDGAASPPRLDVRVHLPQETP